MEHGHWALRRQLLRRWEDDFSIAEAAPTGQNVGVEAGTLQFGVEKAKVNWGAFIHNMGLGRTMSETTMNSRYDPTSGPGPSVVVHNANGEKRLLEVTKTIKEARDRAAAMEQDLNRLTRRSGVSATTFRFPSSLGDPQHQVGAL
jgi:hypothetical protein